MEKGQLFEIGQEVTPNIESKWLFPPGHSVPEPKMGEIYTVHSYIAALGKWCICLTELGPDKYCYCQHQFSPVITDKQLEDALKEVDELVTIK